jgi:hypothetical protein
MIDQTAVGVCMACIFSVWFLFWIISWFAAWLVGEWQ